MSKKVLILAGDAVEALEIYYPYFRCLEEGYEVTIAAPTAKKLQTVVHDFIGWETYAEKEGYLIKITVCGNGFLYNMVRIIVGTLIEVGRGRIAPKDMVKILKGLDRSLAGPTAPAHGLTLSCIEYDMNQIFKE